MDDEQSLRALSTVTCHVFRTGLYFWLRCPAARELDVIETHNRTMRETRLDRDKLKVEIGGGGGVKRSSHDASPRATALAIYLGLAHSLIALS